MNIAQALEAHGIEEHSFHVGQGFSKLFKMPAGSIIGQHSHTISHDSILLIGRAIVKRNGLRIEVSAPAVVHMPAHIAHEIEAVTPVLWACNWPNADGLTTEQLEQRVTE